jgi:hypothetical protein
MTYSWFRRIPVWVLFTFVLANVLNVSLTNSILNTKAHAAIRVDPSSSSLGLSNTNTGSVISTFSNPLLDIGAAQTQADEVCTANQVTLTTSKRVTGGGGLDLTNLSFDITVTRSQQPTKTFTLFNGGSQGVCINVGEVYTVVETGKSSSFTFTTTYINNPPGSSSPNQCSGTPLSNQPITCSIINSITGSNNGRGALQFDDSTPAPPSSPQQSEQVTSPQAPEGPTSTGAGTSGRITNPPFQTCFGNTISTASRLGGSATVTDLVRAPSAGQYIIEGAIPLDKVRSAMSSLNTNIITITLLSDLLPEDGVSTAVANPQFTGKVIVTDPNDGAKQRIINFGVDAVRTECKFITIAKPAGKPPNSNVAPLAELNDLKNKNIRASDIDKLLIGGVRVTTSNTQGQFAPVLNPPFATCQSPASTANANLANSDDLALYNVKGTIKSNDISGKSLTVEITADLQQADTDLAKIIKNNNPFIKVNLIADENRASAKQIPFTLSDLWTDCKDISLATKTVFQPKAGEVSP